MDEPKYVLELNEAVLMPTKQSPVLKFLKIGVWCVVILIILGSFFFKDNLFLELSWFSRCVLIVLAIAVTFFAGKKEDVPSPMELRFYDDCIVIYRKKRYYSSRVSRMEYNKMLYSKITKCVYRERSRHMMIYGDVDATWYDYKKDGSVPETPTYKRLVTGAFQHFSMKCAGDVDIKKEIEGNSPLTVISEDV